MKILKSINTKATCFGLLLLITILYYRFVLYEVPKTVQSYCWYDQTNKDHIVIDCIACHNFQKLESQRGYVKIFPQRREIVSQIVYQTDCLQYQCKQLAALDDFQYRRQEGISKLLKFGFTKKAFQDQNNHLYFQQLNNYFGFMLRFRYLINRSVIRSIEQVEKPIISIYSVSNSLLDRITFSVFGLAVWESINPLFLFGFLDPLICTILSALAIYLILSKNHCLVICITSVLLWVIAVQDKIHPAFIQVLTVLLIAEELIFKNLVKSSKFRLISFSNYSLLIITVLLCKDAHNMILIYIYVPQLLYFFSKLDFQLKQQGQQSLRQQKQSQGHLQLEQQEMEI